MRAAVEDLDTPHPLHAQLPAVYADDAFAGRLLAALDSVLAPVFATLDCLPGYLDPRLAPADFVDWLGGWVAADVDADWPLPRRREAVARAVELHRLRGTRRGLAEQIRMAFGVTAEIAESGGTSWSATPRSPLPGSAETALTVRVRVRDPAAVPLAQLRHLVETNRPAHVPCRVEVVEG
jgi:phage tail-like protein